MMGWGHDMSGWGGLCSGWILMPLFWIVAVVVIVALGRGVFSRGGWSSAAPDSPLEILKRRYAKGEIDKAEFEEKKKDLL